MSLSSFFSSFVSTVYADAPEDKEEPAKEEAEEQPAEEEEEEEPEDVSAFALPTLDRVVDPTLQPLPELQEECKQSAKCAAATKHFEHCNEKVNAGEGFHGENCIEEL